MVDAFVCSDPTGIYFILLGLQMAASILVSALCVYVVSCTENASLVPLTFGGHMVLLETPMATPYADEIFDEAVLEPQELISLLVNSLSEVQGAGPVGSSSPPGLPCDCIFTCPSPRVFLIFF